MTANEKAEELVAYFKVKCSGSGRINEILAIECSIYTVREILKVVPMYTGNLNPTWRGWNDVKSELEKMK